MVGDERREYLTMNELVSELKDIRGITDKVTDRELLEDLIETYLKKETSRSILRFERQFLVRSLNMINDSKGYEGIHFKILMIDDEHLKLGDLLDVLRNTRVTYTLYFYEWQNYIRRIRNLEDRIREERKKIDKKRRDDDFLKRMRYIMVSPFSV